MGADLDRRQEDGRSHHRGARGKEEKSETGLVKREVVPVLIAGEEPRLKGWKFIAALDYDEASANGGPWLRVVPGETLPVEYRTVDPTRCDHCRTKRDRVAVFALRHDDGRWAIVGRSCLMDFLGGRGTAMDIAGAAESIFAIFDAARGMEESSGGRSWRRCDGHRGVHGHHRAGGEDLSRLRLAFRSARQGRHASDG
ncbi:MAG: hypothetical protein HC882_06075 [Acidobacteria bacterium]|nr:hypothetical protein [Acidobacteriota bacterium]